MIKCYQGGLIKYKCINKFDKLNKGKFKHLGNITSVRDKLFNNDVNFRIKEIWEDKKAKKVKNIDDKRG